MATGVGYYKCSPELYAKYLAAGRIVDTDFYFVEDKVTGEIKLYIGQILLSNVGSSLDDIFGDPMVEIVFDGGEADVTLMLLDKTLLE